MDNPKTDTSSYPSTTNITTMEWGVGSGEMGGWEEQPTTNNQQPTTNNQQPTTSHCKIRRIGAKLWISSQLKGLWYYLDGLRRLRVSKST